MTAAQQAVRLTRSPATGAAAAQLWQALGSFGLQIAAAWTLGAAGLGTVSLCLGVIVLASSLAGGMVGDSLVILDRHDPRIRAGLQAWALILAAGAATVAGVTAAVSGLLTPGQAALFALALAAFQLEELVRRLFMATMRFWTLVVMDTVAVGVTLALVGGWLLLWPLSLGVFFAAIAAGQLLAIGVGVLLLPRAERVWAPIRHADLRAIWSLGSWRSAQVAVPPLVLTLSRTLVLAVAGGAALGLVEAARILVAPVLLTVQGVGSFLLSSYARDADLDVTVLVRRARRASVAMIGASLGVGALLVVAAPGVAPLVTGPHVAVERITVAGWVLYAAASASLQPFASLAVVQRRQRIVLLCRLADAVGGLALLGLLLVAGVPPAWAPYALAVGLGVGGLLVRRLALAPLLREAASATPGPLAPTSIVGARNE